MSTAGNASAPGGDRSVDVALAEFTALRAELLSHSTSQITVVGLGLPAIGVLLGLAVTGAAQRGLLVLVPVLCAVLILVYSGLAYRVVIVGNYIRVELWPFLERRTETLGLPSWERSHAALESRHPHRWLSQVVELCLVGLLLVLGVVAAAGAEGLPLVLRGAIAFLLGLTTGVGVWLGWRRELARADFAR